MKKYIKPVLEIYFLNNEDIIVMSTPTTDLDDVEEKPGDTGVGWDDFF